MLAALGLVVSPRRRDVQRSVFLAGDELTRRGDRRRGRASSGEQARAELGERATAELRAIYELRYRGQAFELPIGGAAEPDPDELREAFEAEHEERYGYRDPEQELELVTIRVSATRARRGRRAGAAERARRVPSATPPGDARRREVELEVLRGSPPPGTQIAGPAVVELPESTLLVPPGWSGEVDETGTIHLPERSMMDPVELQVLTGALRAICEEMGAVLIRSAHSANIKERRDASTRAVRRPAARWSCRPSTSRSTWGRCRPRWPPCSTQRPRARSAPGSSTTPTAAAPTCPTSP